MLGWRYEAEIQHMLREQRRAALRRALCYVSSSSMARAWKQWAGIAMFDELTEQSEIAIALALEEPEAELEAVRGRVAVQRPKRRRFGPNCGRRGVASRRLLRCGVALGRCGRSSAS